MANGRRYLPAGQVAAHIGTSYDEPSHLCKRRNFINETISDEKGRLSGLPLRRWDAPVCTLVVVDTTTREVSDTRKR